MSMCMKPQKVVMPIILLPVATTYSQAQVVWSSLRLSVSASMCLSVSMNSIMALLACDCNHRKLQSHLLGTSWEVEYVRIWCRLSCNHMQIGLLETSCFRYSLFWVCMCLACRHRSSCQRGSWPPTYKLPFVTRFTSKPISWSHFRYTSTDTCLGNPGSRVIIIIREQLILNPLANCHVRLPFLEFISRT